VPGAAEAARLLLSDPDWRVRAAAARALEGLQVTAAVPALSAALRDPQWWVRFRSAVALAGMGEGGGIDFGALLPIVQTIAGTAAGFFAFLIIPIWAFYILRDRVHLTEQLASSLPASWRDEVWSVLSIVERVFGRWIRGQILLMLIVGAATFAGLLVLGWTVDARFIQFAVLLAVIAGLFELLPIIGPIISMIPTLLVGLTTRDPLAATIGVLVLYTAVQQLENAVLVPKIQGDAVQLHPSLVIFALIVGGAIAGLLGAILAIPITAAARDVYRYLFHRLSEDELDRHATQAADAPSAAPAVNEPRPPRKRPRRRTE
jgi:predicted PurR-regulated permease PerM